MRFSDLLARSVAVEWYEAVALVRDVTDRLLEKTGTQIVPELHQIEISPDGHVAVTGGTMTDDPVRRLGQLLQAAIAQSEPPIQLRLVVTQSTGANPAFSSIHEYSSALAYFERPDRAAVLRSLYARAAAAPAAPESFVAPTLDSIAPLEITEPWDLPATTRPPPLNNPSLWVAIGAALLAIAGTAAYLRFGPGLSRTGDVSAIALKASDAVGSAVVSGISAVTERAGLGRLAPNNSSSVTPAPAAPVETPKAAPPVRKAAPLPTPQIPKVVAFDLEPSPIAEETVAAAAAAPSPPPLTGAAEPPEKTAKEDLIVYSPASAGVVPPVGIRPQLPKELPANVDRSQLGRIELVVLPDGTVGSVKLLDHPHNVHESMFLSAVKAWEFRPASKDGRPVPYRKIIWMAFQ